MKTNFAEAGVIDAFQGFISLINHTMVKTQFNG